MIWTCQFGSRGAISCQKTYILLHAQEGLSWPVLSVAHVAEFLQVLLDRLLGVLAAESRAGPLLTTALELDFLV